MNNHQSNHRILILLLTFFLITSCHGQLNKQTVLEDSVKRVIPEDKTNEKYQKLTRDIENRIGLNDLQNGFDSLQVRIWNAMSSSEENLVILKYNNHSWTGKEYSLRYIYSEKNNQLLDVIIHSHEVIPDSTESWLKLIDELNKLKIFDLPDMSELDNYQIGFDGRTTTVEYATKNLYKIYSYWEPQMHEKRFWQARSIIKLNSLLQTRLKSK